MFLPSGPSSHRFARNPPSTTGPGKRGPVLAVGRRVLVCARGAATLTENDGTTAVGSIADGVEVELLAWQPWAAGGPRYRVLSMATRVEGWIGANNLKPRPVPPSSQPPVRLGPVSHPKVQTGRAGTGPARPGISAASARVVPVKTPGPAKKLPRRPAARSRLS